MSDNQKTILEHVPPARREFLKRLLAGSAFAVPVIATFSIDALTAPSAQAASFPNAFYPNSVCPADTGYAGLTTFVAHVSLGVPPVLNFGKTHRVNGEVALTLVGSGGYLNSIQGTILMVPSAIPTSVMIKLGLIVVAHPQYTGGSSFRILQSDLVTNQVCDLNELADMMASLEATITVGGTFLLDPFSVSGPILPSPATPA